MEEVIQRLSRRQSTWDGAYDNTYYCNGRYYNNYDDCYSNWYSWGRWVFIAGIIVSFLILFILCACLTRRRRRRGLQPYYGTAWMPFRPPPPTNQQPPYDPHGYYAPPNAPAPPYTPTPPVGSPYYPPQGQNGGYYPPPPPQGQGYEMNGGVTQHNTGATRESDYYAPPPGPPPPAHVGKM